ncbi:hypothetical protein LFT51_02025 [Mycobacterium intracellulare subsp. chimaera]|uniref:hypothetical protein n=2 Tax=Mycobacteriaceae TaxID=1762 RepID=UPI0011AB4A6B|nr:hypothetical protein [Mycobacterium intracellulare]QGK46793.1 hypothetical protein GJE02_02000 [Mycobacterium intracellulare subsp. chimaera]UCN04439.1 hypothetical protein LFT51_02025 [Mycobacterium intracellulare subsp. chimaera]
MVSAADMLSYRLRARHQAPGSVIDEYKRGHNASDTGLGEPYWNHAAIRDAVTISELTSLPTRDNLRAMAAEIDRP